MKWNVKGVKMRKHSINTHKTESFGLHTRNHSTLDHRVQSNLESERAWIMTTNFWKVGSSLSCFSVNNCVDLPYRHKFNVTSQALYTSKLIIHPCSYGGICSNLQTKPRQNVLVVLCSKLLTQETDNNRRSSRN